MQPIRKQAQVVVVGSGPGGASVARELARAGIKVAVLERGRDERRAPYYGTHLGPLLYTDRRGLFFSAEGLHIVRPLMLGGATGMYCGSAAPPPAWLNERYGLDLQAQASAAAQELRVAPLPPHLRGQASTQIAEAAASLGQDWEPQPKFMAPERAPGFNCGAHCVLGCRCQAKWSAAEWVDQATAAGAELFTQARVTEVLRSGAAVAGVRAQWQGSSLEVEAPIVVLAAGGLGSPEILRRSGLDRLGEGLAMDTTVIVYGRARSAGLGAEPPMTWSYQDRERGFMLSTLIDPWLVYPLVNGLGDWRRALTWPRWPNTLGVMVKLKDDLAGAVIPDGRVTKPFSSGDRARLDHATQVARCILVAAGADASSLFVSSPRGTHPSATVRLGQAVDLDLQTSLSGLHVCDASVFPEALGQPTVLTIIALGKRLAEHLLVSRALRSTLGAPAAG